MSNIILVVTGSIYSIYFWKIQEQLEKGNNVKVLFTDNARNIADEYLKYYFMQRPIALLEHFNNPKFEKISGRGYKYSRLKYEKYSVSFPLYYHDRYISAHAGFEYENYRFSQTGKIEHIELTKWADKVVVTPCTMNTIVKMCNGITDNFVATFLSTFLGTSKPICVVLGINDTMNQNSALKYNIDEFNDRCTYLNPLIYSDFDHQKLENQIDQKIIQIEKWLDK